MKPKVLIKAAISLDGKIATNSGESQWISNAKSRAYVHRLRSEYEAICVGVQTVVLDNPRLTIRLEGQEERSPIRLVLDSKGRIPLNSTLLNDAFVSKTWILTTSMMSKDMEEALGLKGARVVRLKDTNGHVDWLDSMRYLESQGIKSIFIEGGGEIIASALKAQIVDVVSVAIAPLLIGGQKAKGFMAGEGIDALADAIHLCNPRAQWMDEDIILEYDVVKGDKHGT